MKLDTYQDFEIWIGEHAADNWEIFKASHSNDLWFHLDSVSSASIILRVCDKKVTPKVIRYVSELLKSLHKKSSKVIYRKCSQVSLGDKVGSFIHV